MANASAASGGDEKSEPAATLGQRLKAHGLSCLLFVFAWMPSPLAYGIAWCAAPLLVWGTRRREKRVAGQGRGLVRNQRIALREDWNEARSNELLWAWARHLTAVFVDVCRMRRIHAGNIHTVVDTSEVEQLAARQAEGRGVICASGHMGIWELAGHVTSLCGLPTTSVARPQKNPAIEAVLHRHRTRGGQKIVAKWGVLWSLRKALSRGEIIGIAADENDENYGVFVPFLGTLAATNTTPAFLAGRTGAPIVVATCQRVGRGRFAFRVWDSFSVPKGATSDRDVEGITARISAALSRAIHEYPEQWLWGSRRFRSRPDGEQPGADGLPPPAAAAPPWPVAPTG